jgi:predicted metalloprotease with PDZ domain
MKYIVSYQQLNQHLIDIEFIISNNTKDYVDLQLPAWRPGRYELGNFAKNIQKWAAFDDKGNALSFNKITKDCWRVKADGVSTLHIKYNYYAYQLDAGACWLDDKQLYVNGIHCFMYVVDRINEACEVELKVPDDYKIACGTCKTGKTLHSLNFHELVDSPFIASANIQHNSFDMAGTTFHIWFQGECKPDWERIIKDTEAYTKEQIDMMGSFPAKEYHYLIQVTPYKHYHGVEHSTSTVIAIGPGYNLMKPEVYIDLIGVNSHELFHTWNIKAIRPVELQPYNYVKENYTALGYVAEGITTYYGDLFLIRSNVYTLPQYFEEVNTRLQKHFDNYGRFNMSVAASSFDTWLDGYVPGIPNRKTSIYDEGCLCAMMVDLIIRKESNNTKSLDDVMRALYNDFAKKGIGYSEHDYKTIVENIAGVSFNEFFANYYYGTNDYTNALQETLAFAGCELVKKPAKTYYENKFGFKVIIENGLTKVSAIAPQSIVDAAGLSKDDEIITINNFKVENNLNDWCNYFAGSTITLTVLSQKTLKIIVLNANKSEYYQQYSIALKSGINDKEKAFFKAWTKQDV